MILVPNYYPSQYFRIQVIVGFSYFLDHSSFLITIFKWKYFIFIQVKLNSIYIILESLHLCYHLIKGVEGCVSELEVCK